MKDFRVFVRIFKNPCEFKWKWGKGLESSFVKLEKVTKLQNSTVARPFRKSPKKPREIQNFHHYSSNPKKHSIKLHHLPSTIAKKV
jgi:hypothetical protein